MVLGNQSLDQAESTLIPNESFPQLLQVVLQVCGRANVCDSALGAIINVGGLTALN